MTEDKDPRGAVGAGDQTPALAASAPPAPKDIAPATRVKDVASDAEGTCLNVLSLTHVEVEWDVPGELPRNVQTALLEVIDG